MNNSDKFLVAVQTGLLANANQKKHSIDFYAQKMLDAIKISERYKQEGFQPSNYAISQDVKGFLEWALLGTKHEWIESKLK